MLSAAFIWSGSQLSVSPYILHGKILTLHTVRKVFNQILFIFSMLIATTDFYHSIPFSVTLTLAGVTVSAESKTCWLHFLVHFFTDEDKMYCSVVLK